MTTDDEVVVEVLRILDEWRPAEDTIRAIKRVVDQPEPVPPAPLDAGRWPLLRSSQPSTAWERHDDPEMNR